MFQRDEADGDGHRGQLIERFTRAERLVHRVTATLMLTLIATGAVLYLPSLSVRIGHRQTVALIHLYSGWALPIPMAAGLLSRAYRADVRRLSRHTETDRTWLRKRCWRPERAHELGLPVGKFNAGQKLNAAFQCGSIVVMVGTGTLMWFPHLVGVSMRTGATFVHDWLALAIGFVVVGHVWFALNDRQARAGMRTGWVTRRWAEYEHGGWAAEVAESAESESEAAGSVAGGEDDAGGLEEGATGLENGVAGSENGAASSEGGAASFEDGLDGSRHEELSSGGGEASGADGEAVGRAARREAGAREVDGTAHQARAWER